LKTIKNAVQAVLSALWFVIESTRWNTLLSLWSISGSYYSGLFKQLYSIP